MFDAVSKRFLPCQIEEAVQQCAIAPEGYYIILKNPAVKSDFPPFGGVFPAPDLDVGKKNQYNWSLHVFPVARANIQTSTGASSAFQPVFASAGLQRGRSATQLE
jgi:hypothetical protein